MHAHTRQGCKWKWDDEPNSLQPNKRSQVRDLGVPRHLHQIGTTLSAFKHHNTTVLSHTTRNQVPVIRATELHTTDVDQPGEYVFDQLQGAVGVEGEDGDGVSASVQGRADVTVRGVEVRLCEVRVRRYSGEQKLRGSKLGGRERLVLRKDRRGREDGGVV